MILNLQEYSIQDGEGIRVTVFMKGCPLRCQWCCNPEGQNFIPELMHFNSLCGNCLQCKSACPNNAVFKTSSFPLFNREVCSQCGEKICVDACPKSALKISGEEIKPSELFKRIIQYRTFFNNSNGGVTLSGGEPLAQPGFVKEFVVLCKINSINCGLETCGYFNWDNVKDFITKFDFIYFDIKCTNKQKHLKFTGLDFNTIKNNLRFLSELYRNGITISVPVIPELNDNEDEISNIADLCTELNLKKIRLLPYHNFGISKYEELGLEYKLSHLSSPSAYKIDKFKEILYRKNLNIVS